MFSYDSELCNSLRADDLQALESIYPDYIVEYTGTHLRLEIPIELGVPRDVTLVPPSIRPSSSVNKSRASTTPISLTISHLPPVLLDLFLPDGYPLIHPPTISSLLARQGWVPSEPQLAQVLLNNWSEGESVLCTWVELIRSGDFLDQLRLINEGGTIWYVHYLHRAQDIDANDSV